jgi:hypothetical protein
VPGAVDRLHAARRGRHKLVYDHETGEAELYDLERDPGEQENLVETEAAIAGELRELLLRRSGRGPIGAAVELSDQESELLRRLGYAE